ncbi:unnamed protein product [Prorocentrum cordatum]|uniref:Uncharacterized protein n=1 Tax=Prorocentrum cordatum TaxID=2364126 RepID=A0ABN9XWI5_9DINO|nr:unnamed protein product [Polarella glacialis]
MASPSAEVDRESRFGVSTSESAARPCASCGPSRLCMLHGHGRLLAAPALHGNEGDVRKRRVVCADVGGTPPASGRAKAPPAPRRMPRWRPAQAAAESHHAIVCITPSSFDARVGAEWRSPHLVH